MIFPGVDGVRKSCAWISPTPLNRVPLVYVGRPAMLTDGGALQDIAPTLLALMGLPKPPEMTGHALVRFTEAKTRQSAVQ